MSANTDVVRKSMMSFNPADLNDGTLPAERYESKQKVTYNGKNVRVRMNGISDSFKVDIVAGHRLEVCKNQFINHRNFDFSGKGNGEPVVRAHFKLIGKGEHLDCACGACGFEWHFEEDICQCEQKPPIDPGKEKCSIQ